MANILEALQNARLNLTQNSGSGLAQLIAKEQLKNAVTLLEKGYNIYTEVEPLLDQYGDVDNVPGIDENDEINQDN